MPRRAPKPVIYSSGGGGVGGTTSDFNAVEGHVSIGGIKRLMDMLKLPSRGKAASEALKENYGLSDTQLNAFDDTQKIQLLSDLAKTEAVGSMEKTASNKIISSLSNAIQTIGGTKTETETTIPEGPQPEFNMENLTGAIPPIAKAPVAETTTVPKINQTLSNAFATLVGNKAITPDALSNFLGIKKSESLVPENLRNQFNLPVGTTVQDFKNLGYDAQETPRKLSLEDTALRIAANKFPDNANDMLDYAVSKIKESRGTTMIEKGLPAETAGKLAALQQAEKDMNGAIGLIFPNGIDKDPSTKAMIGGYLNIPLERGREINSYIENAIAAKLRIETGATANESEVKNIASRFFPVPGLDDAQSTKNKLTRLQEFLRAGQFFIDPSGKLRQRSVEDLAKSSMLSGESVGEYTIERVE